MEKLSRRLGLVTNPMVFYVSATLIVAFVVLTIAFTDPAARLFSRASTELLAALGWFYILGVTVFLGFLLWIALGRHGRLRLGADDDRPRYSNPVWFGMLFAAGIGTILMFWGVAEPIAHYTDPPPFQDVAPRSDAAADQAITFSLYHFGLHTWAIFALPGLGFAYFTYRRGLPMRVSSVLHPLLGDRIRGRLGNAIDIVAVVGTIFGVATSLGLGTLQINSGLNYLTGVDETLGVQIALIAAITVVAVISVALGLDAGIRRLSNLNIGLAVLLLAFVIAAGPTLLVAHGAVESTGRYLTNLPELAFWTDTATGSGWQHSWTTFYWAWTITWAPFVGIFIARISRGRTIREFVLGVLFLPAIFTMIWFVTFGFSAIDVDRRQGGVLSNPIGESLDNVPSALFIFLENLPLTGLVSALAVLIVVIFFTTSSDSASFVVDMLCSSDVTDDPPTRQRVFWAIAGGAVAATLLSAGGLGALQEVITVLGFPFFLLGLVIIYCILHALGRETREHAGPRGRPAERPPARVEGSGSH